MTTLPTAPMALPLGSCAQPSAMRYGFGSPCASTVARAANDDARASAPSTPTARALIMIRLLVFNASRIIRAPGPGGDGRWTMGDGRWAMGDGQWAMGNGR